MLVSPPAPTPPGAPGWSPYRAKRPRVVSRPGARAIYAHITHTITTPLPNHHGTMMLVRETSPSRRGDTMDRKQYDDQLTQISNQVHALHSSIHALMQEVSAAASTQTTEWNLLYSAFCQTGIMSEMLYRHFSPLPSALADDDEADDDVPMVCTACRKPVERTRGDADRSWQHATELDAIECPRSGSVVTAMVAAGSDII